MRYETLGQLCAAMLEEVFQHVQAYRGDIAYDIIGLHETEESREPQDFHWFVRSCGTHLYLEYERPQHMGDAKEYLIKYRPGEGFMLEEVN